MSHREGFARAADATRLWWRASGEGRPALVLNDGIGCAGFIWKYLEPDLARRHRVVRWNYRGHGRSEKPQDPARVALADCVDDLFRVLDAAGEEKAVLFGHSMGVQVALEAHRRAPARVAGLVLVCGSYGRPLDTFHDGPILKNAFPWANALIQRFPGAARWVGRTFVPTELSWAIARNFELNGKLIRREDFFRYFVDLAEVDLDLFARMLATAAVHDTYDHLPRVDVPTLVVAGEKDTFTPMWLSVRMHAAIAGSEFLALPGGSHAGPLEHPELVALRLEKFLAAHFGEPAAGKSRRRPASRRTAAPENPGGASVAPPARRSGTARRGGPR